MLSFSLGPLVFTPARLVLISAIAVALLASWLYGRRHRVPIEPVSSRMLLWGFISARVVFVLLYREDYWADPLSIIDIRDGGFSYLAGMLVASAVGVHYAWKNSKARSVLGVAVVAGLLTWGGGYAYILGLQTQPLLAKLPLITERGDKQVLAELGRKPMVINLWATWCGPCRREMPVLFAAQQREPGITFIFVNQGEAMEAVTRFLKGEELPLENVFYDRESVWSRQLGAGAMPTTLFISADGSVVGSHTGELSPATLRRGLMQLK